MILKFILIGLGMVLGDLLMKTWSNYNYSLQGLSLIIYLSALLTYGTALTYYGHQLQTTNFSIATTLPIILNIIIIAALTIFYYKEPLSLNALLGTALALLSIVFFYFA
jgi:uncharacterized protein (DUF486 family)